MTATPKSPSRSRVGDERQLCQFTFADGRGCRMFRSDAHPNLCLFHAREELQILQSEKIANELASLSGRYRTHTDINHVVGKLFNLVAAGLIPPARARNLSYLAQLLLQSQKDIRWETNLAYNFDHRAWDSTVRAAYPKAPHPATPPSPVSSQAPQPDKIQPPAPNPVSAPGPQHPVDASPLAQPAPPMPNPPATPDESPSRQPLASPARQAQPSPQPVDSPVPQSPHMPQSPVAVVESTGPAQPPPVVTSYLYQRKFLRAR